MALLCAVGLMSPSAFAEDTIGNFDWHSPGDGKTPTIFQYLDTAKGTDAKEATHFGMATSKGDGVYSYNLDLPPALLKPSLSLSYSSETEMGAETPYGWSLGGIVEIRRPLTSNGYKIDGPKHGRDYLLSGPGLSGVLKPSGNADLRFFLKTSDPNYVTAEYDQSANTWTVFHDTVKYTLEEQDDGDGTSEGTALWRVTKMRDRLGNAVDYFYSSDGLISKISYGGNAEVVKDHLIDIHFRYAKNAAGRTNARAGFVVRYDKHLTLITVNTWDASLDGAIIKSSLATIFEQEDFGLLDADDQADAIASTRLYAFDLGYTRKDSLDLLTTLEREGKTARDAETIATFTYSVYDDDFDGDDKLDQSGEAVRVSSKAPSSLGGSYQTSETGATSDETTHSLLDFNRDGLPDVIDSSADDVTTTKEWQVTSQSVNHDARTFDWNSAQSVTAVGAAAGSTITDAVDLNLSHNLSHTTRELIDFDGDGYLDVVESGNATQWTVSYGRAVGHEFKVYTETLPDTNWTYSAESWRLNADHADAANVTKDLIKGLMDFNGDGWQDLYDPASGVVWLHFGTRGGGWDEKLELSQPDGSTSSSSQFESFEALRSVKYTLAEMNLPNLDASALCTQYQTYSRMGAEPGSSGRGDYAGSVTNADGSDTELYHDAESELDEAVAALLAACEEMYGSITLHKMRILYTDEIGGFYDLNGDGLKDNVDSDHNENWRVSLNNGHDFEDAVNWAAPFSYSRRADATTVYQMLIDVDADGLLDLARTKDLETATTSKIWHRNTGSGFEEKPRDLPNWWPYPSFTTTVSTNNVFDENTALAETMMDLDHDGALDRVSIEMVGIYDGSTGMFTDTYGKSEVHYGPYPKPYILTKVQNGQGGTTELAYRSLATVSPSGDFTQRQHTPNIKHLVDFIASTDGLTGQNAETLFHYANGYFEDDVFQGFASRRVTRKINDSWVSSSDYEYELDHDWDPLVTAQGLYTDSNLNFAPSLARGSLTKALHFLVTNTYQDDGDYFHLLKKRQVTEYGETSSSKTVTHVYSWDNGNLTSYAHDGGGVADDALNVAFSYVADNASAYDARFYRMAKRQVSGTDQLGGSSRVFEDTRYYYDDHTGNADTLTNGQVTKMQTLAGWIDGGEALDAETLEIKYTRGTRGEVLSATDVATGIKMDQTYGFGGAVSEMQTNGLGQSLTQVLDEQGRVSSMTDPNGLKIELIYDAFGRETKKKVTGTDGETHVLSDSQYFRTSAPYYTMNRVFDEFGAVEQTSYELEDGFGHVAESWTQGDDGHYLVTQTITDLRGLVRTSSHPDDRGSTFSVPTSSFTISNPFTRSYYDALGTPRETVRDVAIRTGSQLVYYNKPWLELRQDEEGYQTRITYDAHRRVTQVEQGKSNSFTTTATYRYDPLNRLVSFKDGGGTIYTYSYDGAGRLRQVKHGKTGTPGMTNWYKYQYTGLLKTKMMDNSGAYATWAYDVLGRPTMLTVSDSLPSSTGPLDYTYEYDTAWVGSVYKTTDPAGSTTYKHDKYGREESVKRAYAASSTGTQTPEFLYDTNLQGQLRIKTYPSGHRLKSSYSYGLLTVQTAMSSGVEDYTLAFSYNDWGLPESVISSLGHKFTNTFTTPLWVDEVKMQFDTTSYQTKYTWANNGLLTQRAENIGTGSAIYNYEYDALKQLTQMATPTKNIESYTYDVAGNPLTMQDSDGLKWTYAAATSLNQIASRTASTGKTNTYTYDTAGRIKTWKSGSGTQEYYYDGLGRLRGATQNGSWHMVLDYDADGNLVRRGDNNPYTSSPYYKYSFRDWRYDEKTATTTEDDNAIVSAENGTRKWLFKGFDGHAGLVFNDDGVVESQRSLGAYGSVLNSAGTTWDWNAFHGAEDQGELIHMGQRHLIQNDGTWLQPEPLLYLGIKLELLGDPLTLATRRYARNAPTAYQDRTGMTTIDYEAADDYVIFHPNKELMPANRDFTYSASIYSYQNANAVKGDLNCVAATIAGIFNYLGIAAEARNNVMDRVDAIPEVFGGGGWEFKNVDQIASDLENRGDGAIAAIAIQFTRGGKTVAHTFYATNDKNGVIFRDDQNGDIYNSEELKDQLKKKRNLIIRVYEIPDDFESPDRDVEESEAD
jgi:YD repeat-containing protein